MIALLSGVVHSVGFDRVVINVGGVGYGVSMSVREISRLSPGQEVTAYITEVVREQSYDLYAFMDMNDQYMFESLIKVSGVGPRSGLAILGLGTPAELSSAIKSHDASYIVRAPGVGKKLAERLLIELQDKVNLVDSVEYGTGVSISGGSDAEDALVALGFKRVDVEQMMKLVDKDASVEEQIRQALARK